MAQIEHRTRTDGATSHHVKWRIGGGRGAS